MSVLPFKPMAATALSRQIGWRECWSATCSNPGAINDEHPEHDA